MKIEDIIIPIICQCFEVEKHKLLSPSKRKDLTTARHAFTHLLKVNSFYSNEYIGYLTGRTRDSAGGSTAVSNSISNSDNLYRNNAHYRMIFNRCWDMFNDAIAKDKRFEKKNISNPVIKMTYTYLKEIS